MDISPLELLTTTRAVRRRLDLERPVPRALVQDCLEIALQAPSRSNRQPWRFVLVDDPHLKNAVAAVYRRGFAARRAKRVASPGATSRVETSAEYLAEVLDRVPVLVIPCIETSAGGAPATTQEQASTWGSILPAMWSFMLAARLHGLGTSWTTVHLAYADEVGRLLQLPARGVLQAGLVPVAYTVGDNFEPASRRSAVEVSCWNGWSD